MRRIGRLTVGGLVGMGLIIGLAGVATASSATTTGNTATTNGTTAGGKSPATTVPITTSPTTITTSPTTITTSPSTTSPSTTSPASTAPVKKNRSKKASKVMTGAEIWTIVVGHHKNINCKRATKELKRIQSAVKAASVRLTRWQKMTAMAQKSTAKNAKAVAGRDGKGEKFFQNLSKRGAALIKRIDGKCGAKTATS